MDQEIANNIIYLLCIWFTVFCIVALLSIIGQVIKKKIRGK